MDFIGFFGILALAFFIGPALGLNDALAVTARRLFVRGQIAYERAQQFFTNALLTPTQWMLGVSAFLQLAVGITAIVLLNNKRMEADPVTGELHKILGPDGLPILENWMIGVVALMLISIGLHGYQMARQINSRSRNQMEIDPATGQLQEVLGPDGLPMVDDEAPDFTPGRFSFTRSVAIVIVSFVFMGMLLVFAGADAKSSLIVTFGMLCVYAGLGVGMLISQALAWIIDRGATLVEFVTTLASRQLLVILPNITGANVNALIPDIDLVNQQELARNIRAVFLNLVILITPFLVIVRTWPSLEVATWASSIFFILSLVGWFFVLRGGASEVSNRQYQFARMMFYGIPGYMLLSGIWSILPENGNLGAIKHAIIGVLNWATLFATGQYAFGVGSGFWSAVGSFFLFGIGGIILLGIGHFVGKNGNLLARGASALFKIPGIIALLCLIPIGMRIGAISLDQATVHAPHVLDFVNAPVAAESLNGELKSEEGLLLTWNDVADNETHYQVERRVVGSNGGNSFSPIGGLLKPNTYAFTDKTIQAHTSYKYRIVTINDAGKTASSERQFNIKDYIQPPVDLTAEPEEHTKAAASTKNQSAHETSIQSKKAQTTPTRPAGLRSCNPAFQALRAGHGKTAECAQALAANQ